MKFEVLDQKPGVRLFRVGIGVHQGVPFLRIDLWHKAFRISGKKRLVPGYEDVVLMPGRATAGSAVAHYRLIGGRLVRVTREEADDPQPS